MDLARNNSLIIKNEKCITRSKPLRFDICMCLIYTALIVLGMFNNIGSLAAFVLIVVAFYWLPLENIVCQMMYLMSFAAVFKMSPASTSLFTIIELYVVLLMIWRRPLFKSNELFSLIALVAAIVAGVILNFNLQTLLTIKFISAMLLVMGFKDTDFQKELPNYITLLMIGLMLSSAIVYFGEGIIPIDSYLNRDYIVDSNFMGNYYTDTVRFSGLNADPNYYCINIYIAIVGALVLDNEGIYKKNIWLYCGIAVLFFFGIQTVSKSFALMSFIIMIYLFYISFKNKNLAMVLILVIFSLIVFILAITQKVEIINNLIDRIVESFNKNDITTGRTNIWQSYLDYLLNNPKLLLFGAGFGYGFGGLVAAHNTYIECLACLGIFGTIIFIVFLHILFANNDKSKKRSIENYSVFIIMIVMYFFLSMLTWVDFPFQLFLCYCFLNYKNVKVSEKYVY